MKPSTNDLRAMLEAAGTRPVPAPSPAFVASLEQRLLGMPVTVAPVLEREERHDARRSRLVLLPAAAAIAAVVVAGALTGAFTSNASPTKVKLSAAKDTVVELPNGKEVEGEPGLPLPDGAIVKTGDNGSATFGDVNLGPGEVATVDNGKVVITPPPTTVPTLPITIPTLPITVPTIPGVTLPTIPGLPLP